MREFNRIFRIGHKFCKIWASPMCQDWRFCQLYVNIFGTGDNFYVEDDIVEEKLDKFIEKYNL